MFSCLYYSYFSDLWSLLNSFGACVLAQKPSKWFSKHVSVIKLFLLLLLFFVWKLLHKHWIISKVYVFRRKKNEVLVVYCSLLTCPPVFIMIYPILLILKLSLPACMHVPQDIACVWNKIDWLPTSVGIATR